jgi:hypothetical protein
MKLRLFGALKRLNVEHRTPNFEHPILMTLRYIYFKTSEPNISKGISDLALRSLFAEVGLLSLFIKWQNTVFDVGRSMFDVRRSSVSFPIRLAVFK